MNKPIHTPNGGRRPQLDHGARKMIEERLKKYDDPQNEEWDLGDPHVHRWEHHAISIFRDLIAAESGIAGGRDWDDDMRTLLRSWAACMQEPRPIDWEQIAKNLYADTRVLLGELSLHEEAKGIRS